MITAAQAFHWFDTKFAIKEFSRILKPNGYILLVWNERKENESLFMASYERLLVKFCPEYIATNHKRISDQNIRELFKNKSIDHYRIDNSQDMDLDGLTGRLKSCSYCPKPENENYLLLIKNLENFFYKYQTNNLIRFNYETCLYVIQTIS